MILKRDNVEIIVESEEDRAKFIKMGFCPLNEDNKTVDTEKIEIHSKMKVAELDEIARKLDVDVDGLTQKEKVEVLKRYV